MVFVLATLRLCSMVGLMVNSKRVSAKGDLPVPLSLWWASADPCLHRRSSNTIRWVWFSFIWRSLFISSGSWCMQNFVYALQDWSLCFSQSSRSPVIKSAGLQGQTPYGFPVPLLGSQAGKPDGGVQNLQNSSRTSLVLLFSSLWVTHRAGIGTHRVTHRVWFYHGCIYPTISLGHFLCLWIWGIFLW